MTSSESGLFCMACEVRRLALTYEVTKGHDPLLTEIIFQKMVLVVKRIARG